MAAVQAKGDGAQSSPFVFLMENGQRTLEIYSGKIRKTRIIGLFLGK